MDNKFGQRLKTLRLEHDLKQSELAKILEVSSSTIGMYEQGRRYADLETLTKIANHFNVSVDYLIGRTGIRKFEDFPEPVKRAAELFDKLDEQKSKALERLLIELLEK